MNIPTITECNCGSKIWNIKAMFENGAMSLYFLDMSCSSCGYMPSIPPKLDGGEIDG
jgi:hypothetical protein